MAKAILVTGSAGFIGKHLCLALEKKGYTVFRFDLTNGEDDLIDYIYESDCLIHLAGVNRPEKIEDFYKGNTEFTRRIVELVRKHNPKVPIIYASSIQAELDNDYGKSKKMGEEALLSSGLDVYIYRLCNVFGRGCRPDYNNVIATFCAHIANETPVWIRDPDFVLSSNYIDDVIASFIRAIERPMDSEIHYVEPVYGESLGHIAGLIRYFKGEVESQRHLPLIKDEFELKLFKTFCYYLSDEGQEFNKVEDSRGYFEEIYKSKRWGQISDNLIYPGISKGGHYHNRKKEIFYTVIGNSHIEQRNIDDGNTMEITVDGRHPSPVDIYPNHVHTITNVGEGNSHTLMWISEIYDENQPDTYKQEDT